MKTVKILTTFDGYPNGEKVHYAEGDEVEISNEFADNIIGKGLAREKVQRASAKRDASAGGAGEGDTETTEKVTNEAE